MKQVSHNYRSWFEILPSDNPACGPVKYFIDSCAAPGTSYYASTTKNLVWMTESVVTGILLDTHTENKLNYKVDQPYHEKLCYWTKTQGN
jgi:hypothetical protein